MTEGTGRKFSSSEPASARQSNGTSIGRKLNRHNKLRITGDFVLGRPSGAPAAEGAEKGRALWRRAIRPVTFGDASICHKMVYAKASAIRASVRCALGTSAWVLRSIRLRQAKLGKGGRDGTITP